MYTKFWQYCIIYSHANKAILIELREREREREGERLLNISVTGSRPDTEDMK